MDDADRLNLYCPAAIHQTISDLTASAAPVHDSFALSAITSASLSRDCLIGVMGQLGSWLSESSHANFKASYLGLVTFHADPLMEDDGAALVALRQTIGEGILPIINDVSDPRLAGPMLAALGNLRINLLSEIEAQVSLRERSGWPPMREWTFVEYALCMKDPRAAEQMARLFARSDAQSLRSIFMLTRSKLHRKSYCIDAAALRAAVQPFLDDDRLRVDVSGPGLAVSIYARQLLEAL